MKPRTLTAETCEQLELVRANPGADLTRFPDFLILGPQRTGTSWLNRHLKAHPEIFLPKGKETYFFSTLLEPEQQKFEYPRLEDYTGMAMVDSRRRTLRKNLESWMFHRRPYAPKFFGDATATYATLRPKVIREICLINPEMKAILTMREPGERAWSHAKKQITEHSGRTMDQVDPEKLDKFLRARGQLDLGMYSAMIANWRAHLKTGNLLVAEFRLVEDDPGLLLTEVLQFLGAEAERFPLRRNLAEKVYPTGNSTKPPQVEQRIAELYAAASQDYGQVLEELAKTQLSPGIYRV